MSGSPEETKEPSGVVSLSGTADLDISSDIDKRMEEILAAKINALDAQLLALRQKLRAINPNHPSLKY